MTDTATWTANQNSKLIDKFKANNPKHADVQTDAIGEYLKFEVKSSRKILRLIGNTLLNTGDKIRMYKSYILKSVRNDNKLQITQTIKEFN